MNTLTIVWQRLVNAQGSTCPRCNSTGDEVTRAVERLTQALAPLGVLPVLETRELTPEQFLQHPSESNRIWIGGQPLEHWVGGHTGASRCCDECGEQDCRTVEVDGTSYEVVPEALLVQAGLVAASQLIASQPKACCTGPSCC